MKKRLIGARNAWREVARWSTVAGTALALSSSVAHAQVSGPEVAAAEPSEGFAPELRAELDSYLQGALVAFDVPGAAVAVIEGGRVAYRGTFGVRGDGHPRPVDARTLFMIGSITKSMTSTMLATLVDDALIGWDVPVERLLPSFELSQPEYEPRVTLRHLLSHQSGLSRWDVSIFLRARPPLSLLDEVSRIPLSAAPGERYEYQNQAYALAGFAAARAAGARYTDQGLYRGYERLMQERVFEPVGMRKTTIDIERAVRSDNHAWPHEYSPLAGDVQSVELGFERFATNVAPAGAVWSNIDEMARYALLHMSQGLNARGQRVVSAKNLEETHTPMVSADGAAYGLGWFVVDSPFGRVLTHSGGTAGFGADLVLVPEQGWAIVVLTNRVSSTPFVQAVERYVLETLLGRERSPDGDLLAVEAALRSNLSALLDLTTEVQPADVAGLLGLYQGNVRFSQRGPDLVFRNDFGELTLRAVVGYPGTFLVVSNALVGAIAQFSTDTDGDVSVTVGLPFIEGEDVQLLQPVTLAKLQRPPRGHRPPPWAADPRAEWHKAVRYLRDCGVDVQRPRWLR